MKKILAFQMLVLVAIFSFANVTSAAVSVDCGDGHKIWNVDNSAVVSCIAKADWDRAEAESRNLNQDDGSFVKVMRGQRILTTWGYEDTCPTWFPMNCVIKKALFVHFL